MARTIMAMPISDVSGSITAEVRITGLKWWMLRAQLATLLIRLAGYVAPIRFDIEILNK